MNVSKSVDLSSKTPLQRVIGYFASMTGTLLAGANELLAELTILAERDFLTGLPNQRAFEGKISSHLRRRTPFVLLVGETAALPRLSHGGSQRERENLLLDFAELLRRAAGGEADISRTGNEQFGILVSRRNGGQLAAKLERSLDNEGCQATFGSAMYPDDGDSKRTPLRAENRPRGMGAGRRHRRASLGTRQPAHQAPGVTSPRAFGMPRQRTGRGSERQAREARGASIFPALPVDLVTSFDLPVTRARPTASVPTRGRRRRVERAVRACLGRRAEGRDRRLAVRASRRAWLQRPPGSRV